MTKRMSLRRAVREIEEQREAYKRYERWLHSMRQERVLCKAVQWAENPHFHTLTLEEKRVVLRADCSEWALMPIEVGTLLDVPFERYAMEGCVWQVVYQSTTIWYLCGKEEGNDA